MPLAPRTSRIIGRDQYLNKIRTAIKNTTEKPQILYFKGRGGIGKTRILEEVAEIQKSAARPFYWSGIVDLYHPDHHSPGGLRRALADQLGKGQNWFDGYNELRKEFNTKRSRGITGTGLEELRKQLDVQFLADYTTLAKTRPVVLTFDTVELIQHENSEVREICQVEEEATLIKNWFLEQVSRYPNTVVIFAGRRADILEQAFTEGFQAQGCHFEMLELNEFSEQETDGFLSDFSHKYDELVDILNIELDIDDAETNKPVTVRQRLYEISQGRPIYLAILVDLLRKSEDIGLIFDKLSSGLTEDEIGERLIDLFNELPDPLNRMIYYLIRARKGLDAQLLHYLEGGVWSESEIQRNLEQMRDFAIIKPREKTNQLFLHDEVFDLVDHYFYDDPTFTGEFEIIAKYYRQKATNDVMAGDDIIAWLFYELRLNVERGYQQYYARWIEDAIRRHDIGMDMRLRDEILNFIYRYIDKYQDPQIVKALDRPAFDRDSAVRWVKRYFHRGQYKKADEVARDLRDSKLPLFDWDTIDDPLYKASLLEIWGITRIYRGREERLIRPILREAIQILTGTQNWGKYEEWWVPLVLGQAYVDAGYWHRQNRRYGAAVKFYTAGINQFRHVGEYAILDMALTLANRAFAQANLGNISAAETQIEEAFRLHQQRLRQQKRDFDFWSTLTLAARGTIYRMSGKIQMAIDDNNQAYVQFDELIESRGIAISNLNLGRIYRTKGNAWMDDVTRIEEARADYKLSLEKLTIAFEFFDEQPAGDLIDIYLEESKIERSRGQIELYQGRIDAAKSYFHTALDLLETGIKRAGDRWQVQKIDCLEDMVEIYILNGEFSQARATILEAAELIPSAYFLDEHYNFRSIMEPVEDYWNLLGRLELHRAHMVVFESFNFLPHQPAPTGPSPASEVSKQQQTDALLQAMEYYARAITYFLAYSPDLGPKDTTFLEVYRILKDQDVETLQRVRERVVKIDEDYDTIKLAPLLRHIDEAVGVTPKDDDVLQI